jgi:hypothetical protein
MRVTEDDDFSFGHVLLTIIGSAVGAVGGAAGGGAWGGIAGGVGGGIGGLAAAVALLPSPDDFIGQAAWQAKASDISTRGLLAHDSVLGTGHDPSALKSITGAGFDSHLQSRTAGNHPGVDAWAYTDNAQVMSCSSSSVCGANKVCYLGACVPSDPNPKKSWTDPTLPKGTYDPNKDVAGTIERIRVNGSGADYVMYVATSLSDESGL